VNKCYEYPLYKVLFDGAMGGLSFGIWHTVSQNRQQKKYEECIRLKQLDA